MRCNSYHHLQNLILVDQWEHLSVSTWSHHCRLLHIYLSLVATFEGWQFTLCMKRLILYTFVGDIYDQIESFYLIITSCFGGICYIYRRGENSNIFYEFFSIYFIFILSKSNSKKQTKEIVNNFTACNL